MSSRALILLTALSVAGASWANTYRVRNASDSGGGSLRWALQEAAAHAARDKIIFAAHLAGKVIRPSSALPIISDNQTSINGDINGDGAPDVVINGKNAGASSGLVIEAHRCTVEGLAIISFTDHGVLIRNGTYNTLRSCHVGVNLAGVRAWPNRNGDVYLENANYNTIGGGTVATRNVISAEMGDDGIHIRDGSFNTIAGNYIGTSRNGMVALGAPQKTGIRLRWHNGPCRKNVIGGTTPGARNILGGTSDGINIDHARGNTILGNYFGLAPDGNTGLPIGYAGILIGGGARYNVVGGTATGGRNVFAGNAEHGVLFAEPNTRDNEVQGNYFGTNAAGTEQRRIDVGVRIYGAAGAQIIGGDTAKAGNYFNAKGAGTHLYGVWVRDAGAGSIVRHNKFGMLPNGSDAAPTMQYGVHCDYVAVDISKNEFARAHGGIGVVQPGSAPIVTENLFRRCYIGVNITDNGYVRLGNVNNASAKDDGGNTFKASNTWFILNATPNPIKAEGNDFGSTSRTWIHAKIWDKRDNAARGRVDINPLKGGIVPTGLLSVAGAAAAPTTSGGAEIVFNLSAAADVTVSVLNIAGRRVATLAGDLPSDAGLQRLFWSGLTLNGTPAPSGAYLVRIRARTAAGGQAQAIAPLRIQR